MSEAEIGAYVETSPPCPNCGGNLNGQWCRVRVGTDNVRRVSGITCPSCKREAYGVAVDAPPVKDLRDLLTWPGYPRRVALVGSAVAELSLVELSPTVYAISVDTDQQTITLRLHSTPLADHVGGWVVSELDLVAALEASMTAAVATGVVALAKARAELSAARTEAAAAAAELGRLRLESTARGQRLADAASDAADAAAAVRRASDAYNGGRANVGAELAAAVAACARIGGGW